MHNMHNIHNIHNMQNMHNMHIMHGMQKCILCIICIIFCIQTTRIVVLRTLKGCNKIFSYKFLSFLRGVKWRVFVKPQRKHCVTSGTSALHLNEPTWIIGGFNELIVNFLCELVIFLDYTQPWPLKCFFIKQTNVM